MGAEDFIALSPTSDGGNNGEINENLGSKYTEMEQNSLCDKLNNAPTDEHVRDCNGSMGIENEKYCLESQPDKVFETVPQQIIQEAVERSTNVVEKGCAVVSPSGNGFAGNCNGQAEAEYENNSLEMELDKVMENNPEQSIAHCSEMTAAFSFAENINVIQQSVTVTNNYAVAFDVGNSTNYITDESPILGVKRARMTYIDQEPCVHVVYNSLTRESLKKLKECLQQWSEWHARHENSDQAKAPLEHGEETYFPAIHVGDEKSVIVNFWVDNQPRKSERKENTPMDNDSEPLYDRGYVLGPNSFDASTNLDRLESLEASRCFNCGSYSHSLKECPRPRDNVAINNARKNHGTKKNPNTGPRGQSRYYISSPGKFDDLRPGVLGPETRQCLGIAESDPPPWLQRMREIGYPPGYLDAKEDEDQPSGITIFADEDVVAENEEGELPESSESGSLNKKMTVDFPGINAPIPENADHRQWKGSTPNTTSLDTWRRYHQNSNSSSDTHRSHSQDQRRSRENVERVHYDQPPGSSSHAYSTRYGSYDRVSIPSPTLSRSHSDRGWRSPLGYEGSPGYGYQTPPSHYSSRDSSHHYTPVGSDRWDPHGTYHGSSNSSSHGRDRDRHDHPYHHR